MVQTMVPTMVQTMDLTVAQTPQTQVVIVLITDLTQQIMVLTHIITGIQVHQ